MKQCILTVSTWLMNSERPLRVTVDLSETYPTMEAQGPVPELLRKVLNAYDMVNKSHARRRHVCEGRCSARHSFFAGGGPNYFHRH